MTLVKLFCLSLLAAGCTLSPQAPLQLAGLEGMQISFNERDWDWIREATPKHLLVMEKDLAKNPHQPKLRANLIRSYSLYATLVFETLAIEERVLDEQKYYQERALKVHQKALDQGEIYIKERGLNPDDLKLEKDDYLPLLYTAKSLAALSFNSKVSPIKAKPIYDAICKINPKIEEGECPLFYARYELVQKNANGADIYKRFLKENPYHLLARAFYMEFALIDLKKVDEFDDEFYQLEDGIRKWQEGAGPSELNLLNATAKVRFRVIQRYKKRIF